MKGQDVKGKKNRSRVPKDHPILIVNKDLNESMETRRYTRLHEIGFIFYTSPLEPKKVEETIIRGESWFTPLLEELNQPYASRSKYDK